MYLQQPFLVVNLHLVHVNWNWDAHVGVIFVEFSFAVSHSELMESYLSAHFCLNFQSIAAQWFDLDRAFARER